MKKRIFLTAGFLIFLLLGGVFILREPRLARADSVACSVECDSRGYDGGNCYASCPAGRVQIESDTCADRRGYKCCCICPDPPCTGWQNESCGANNCGLLEMYQTRTCQPGCGEEESRCLEDLASCCQCDNWQDQGCALNDCSLAEMYQTRECLLDCDDESRCVEDLESCCQCTEWQNQGCGQGGCSILQMYQTRICDPSGCLEGTRCIGDESCGSIPPPPGSCTAVDLLVCPGESIQEAINFAQPGKLVYIKEGSYEGFTVNKNLTLVGEGMEKTIIGPTGERTVRLEGAEVTIMNMKIKGGGYSAVNLRGNAKGIFINDWIQGGSVGGIEIPIHAESHPQGRPIVKGCIITGASRGIFFARHSPVSECVIENNLIYGNGEGIRVEEEGFLYYYPNGCQVTNNTIVANSRSVYLSYPHKCNWVFKNNIFGGSVSGGNQSYNYSMNGNPLFVDYPGRDFHLQPGSPCIDAGDPGLEYNDPDGSRNDIGAYGGPGACLLDPELPGCGEPIPTPTPTPTPTPILITIKELLSNWGPVPPANPDADLNTDGLVNGLDFGMLRKLTPVSN